MPSAKQLCVVVFWITAFIGAVVIAVLPLFTLLPAQCKVLEATSEATKNVVIVVGGGIRTQTETEETCIPKIKVLVMPNNTDEEFEATAKVHGTKCDENGQASADIEVGTVGECWYEEDKSLIMYISDKDRSFSMYDYARFMTLRRIAIALAVIFALCMVLSICSIFKEHLLHWCPRFLLTGYMNLQFFLCGRRQPTPPPSPPNANITSQSVSQPLVAVSRRRIVALVENTKISEEEVRRLLSEGWTCCICLEEQVAEGSVPSVSKLACNHVMHSTCLQSWLERGRGVCCLCNTEVFGNEWKENHNLSPRTSVSGYEAGPTGSLEVERTEGAPSSLATSLFVEIAQTRTTGDGHSDENDCPRDDPS